MKGQSIGDQFGRSFVRLDALVQRQNAETARRDLRSLRARCALPVRRTRLRSAPRRDGRSIASVMARMTTPPSASLRTPAPTTGRLAASVAAMSSRQSAGRPKCRAERGAAVLSTGSRLRAAPSQRSRVGPARARSERRGRADQRRTAAASDASAQSAPKSGGPAMLSVMPAQAPPARARCATPNRIRRADCAASRWRKAALATRRKSRPPGRGFRRRRARGWRGSASVRRRNPSHAERHAQRGRPFDARVRQLHICEWPCGRVRCRRPIASSRLRHVSTSGRIALERIARLITSMREALSVGVRTSTESPKRSSNCGRNSPSSGFAAADQNETRGMSQRQAFRRPRSRPRRKRRGSRSTI